MSENEILRTIRFYNWSHFNTAAGVASDIPERLIGLLNSQSLEEAELWFNKIDNYVVVQGSVYESSYPVLDVLIEAIKINRMTSAAKYCAYELIYQIVGGWAAGDAIKRGNGNIVTKCRNLIECNISILKNNAEGLSLKSYADIHDCMYREQNSIVTNEDVGNEVQTNSNTA